MYFRKANLLCLAVFTTCILTVAAQNAPDEVQVDPNAQCEQGVRDQITACLDQVEKDESKLSAGPCSSSDWQCICTKQQGLVDCYSECPGLQPVDLVKFNGDNCKGQHGQTLKAEGGDLTYTWSQLPFTSESTEPPSVVTPSGDETSASGNTSIASVTSTLAPSSPTPAANTSRSTSTALTKPSTASINNSSSRDGTSSSLALNGKLLVGAVTVITSSLALSFL